MDIDAKPPAAAIDCLPDEILDSVCYFARELKRLPAKSDIRTLYTRRLFSSVSPVPSTLLALRLTCSRLYHTATPHVWRDLDLEIIDCARTGRPRSRNTVLILDYVATHPHLASLVRNVSLNIRHYVFEFDRDPLLMCHLEQSLDKFARAISSVRTFHITNFEWVPPPAAQQLLARPTLRNLVINPPSDAARYARYKQSLSSVHTSSLEAFGWNDVSGTHALFGFSVKFKRVMLYSEWLPEKDVEESMDFSWITNVEELVVSEWRANLVPLVCRQYEGAISAGVRTPLKELLLNLNWDASPLTFSEIILTFRTASLRRLMIYNLVSLEESQIRLIVETFPHLVDLALLTDERGLVPPVRKHRFVDFAKLLQKLSRLQTLEWDIVRDLQYKPGETTHDIGSCTSLRTLGYDVGLDVLASHNRKLKTVRLSSLCIGITDIYTIMRDVQGQFIDFRVRSTGCFYGLPTSWDITTSSYSFF